MKIESSAVFLSSQHSAIEQTVTRESLHVWVGNQRPDFEGNANHPPAVPMDNVTLSEQAKAAHAEETAKTDDQDEEVKNDPRLMLIKIMVEAMTGHKIKLLSSKDLQSKHEEDVKPPEAEGKPAAQPQRAGFGVEYDYHQSHYEMEQTQFSAQGIVKTTDGKEISFSLQLDMSREYAEETNVSLRMGDAPQKKDPLVINFAGTAAQLTDAKFSFDLDADGKADQVSFLASGSGFLALDKSGDGKINDGSELFGPATGQGFQELAAYDEDHNQWIDENDKVYSQLRLFNKDAQGNDVLTTLKQANVGAVYLGNVATPFDIKDGQQSLNGQVRSSGIYLSDSGTAGSVQQIDLAV